MATLVQRQKDEARFKSIEAEICSLRAQVDQMRGGSVCLPITTFAPRPYEILKSIPVIIEEANDEYIASFYDANLGCQASTPTEAFDLLKELLLTRLEYLSKQPSKRLGPAMKKQLAVLRDCIRRRACSVKTSKEEASGGR